MNLLDFLLKKMNIKKCNIQPSSTFPEKINFSTPSIQAPQEHLSPAPQEQSVLLSTSSSIDLHSVGAEKCSPLSFNDNLNYMLFQCEGIFSKTMRKRKLKIEAFSEDEAIEEMLSSGFLPDTITVSRIPFEPPTPGQINAMKKHHDKIPKIACEIDISFLIDKYMYDQPEPDKQLVNFATRKKVKLSYYTGEKSLYCCIWHQFTLEEKFAFYLMCVENDKTGIWMFEKFDSYKSLATNYVNDERFMNSFKRYLGDGKEFYGFNNKISLSASRKTNCYKIALSII